MDSVPPTHSGMYKNGFLIARNHAQPVMSFGPIEAVMLSFPRSWWQLCPFFQKRCQPSQGAGNCSSNDRDQDANVAWTFCMPLCSGKPAFV